MKIKILVPKYERLWMYTSNFDRRTLERHQAIVHKMDIFLYQLVIWSALLQDLVNDTDGVEVICGQLVAGESTCTNKHKLEY